MLEDQQYILGEILRIIDSEAPDAVLIAGDVYDKSVPSAEAVTLLDDFLVQLASRRVQTCLISGNHDSAERLSFGGRLMDAAGIHIAPVYDGSLAPLTLSDEHGPVDIYLLPFLKPVQVRRFFPDEDIESYTDAMAAVLRAAEINADVILLAKNIDGVYNADPVKDPNAVKYDTISYDDVLAQHLAVMDSTATSLSMDNHIPVLLFALKDPRNIIRALCGENVGTIVKE